ncbi:MAG: DUF4160 domain-containing protein [Verrucomicrobiales bacterium]|jgi:hypothetical protein|nr:DUF4160 domain-containing protein [Verrucomicrobiales bacterium]
MPVIFQKNGYRFFFYSNDHEPVHVHVKHGAGEAIFSIATKVELRESKGMKFRELSKALALAEEHQKIILNFWHEYFD